MRGEKLRGGRVAEHAGHVEDDATAALLEELPDRGAVRVNDGVQVEVQCVAQAVIGHFMQRAVSPAAATAAGDVVEGVHPAKLTHRQLHRTLCRLRRGGIRREAPRVRAEGGHSGIHIGLRAAGHDDPGSCCDELFSGRQTQPRRAPHEDDVLAGKGMHVE